ncbi:cellulose synthase (UDP-forming) [Fulvimarina manganoxydans]|uniref:Cellulose synthase catalytic subunit [UDP-forming] n=1 Tax=Fulvimarina manganoxydans TaxID=937218 RepID=A0A1W2EZN6_9HYPH|nr:UDP-forming cellulose synthase catalytic subunit [Fulvimarina manganoxydans]SMD15183.1 cellulose synthase (UDP-forming) [Fulvimarina manganoxydans]
MIVRAAMTSVWMLSAAVFVLAICQSVGTSGQTILATTLVVAMLLLWQMGKRSPTRRILFMALAVGVIGRYAFWRTTETLPPADELMNFIPAVLLYGVEMFAIIVLLTSLFVVLKPLGSRRLGKGLESREKPSVDVFIPTYDESTELLTVTIAAALAMDYPRDRLTVYLLDDGGTDAKVNAADQLNARLARQRRDTLQALCVEMGAVYMTRAENNSAKAGNLNAALPRTGGELVAVFDADHAPARNFLNETVGHFAEDEKLFLVQTPHFFLNPDPIEKNLTLFKRMPSENEMFYGVVQRGLDAWGAAYFCGSAALLRRRALESVNGFSGVTITEDCETALSLHARGWTSRYVDKPLIAGLQPETFEGFIGQRSRWCQGMLQIMILRNPLFARGLSWAQRLCYLSSGIFWLFPVARLTFMLAPLLYIFFNLEIYQASLQEFFAYTALYMLANAMLQNYLYGDVRWPWISELYEYVQSVYLLGAIAAVIRAPKSPTFKVTAKGVTTESDRLSSLAKPYFVIFAAILAGAIWCGWRWYVEPSSRDLLAVVGSWNLLNLVIAGLALGVVSERAERRRNQRLTVSRSGELSFGEQAIAVIIEDVSSSGVRVRPIGFDIKTLADESVRGTLTFEGSAEAGLAVVLRRRIPDARGISLGLEFSALVPTQMRLVADLMYADAAALSSAREHRRPPV